MARRLLYLVDVVERLTTTIVHSQPKFTAVLQTCSDQPLPGRGSATDPPLVADSSLPEPDFYVEARFIRDLCDGNLFVNPFTIDDRNTEGDTPFRDELGTFRDGITCARLLARYPPGDVAKLHETALTQCPTMPPGEVHELVNMGVECGVWVATHLLLQGSSQPPSDGSIGMYTAVLHSFRTWQESTG